MEGNFSFDEPTRVAVIGPIEFIRNVQFEINKIASKKIELFQWRIAENPLPAQAEGLLYFVEAKAQVPTTQLKSVKLTSAVAVFESIIPQQVFAIGEIFPWRMMKWEESRYDKVAQLLLEDLNRRGNTSNDSSVLAHLKSWLRNQGDLPSKVVWTNSPTTWKGSREITLPSDG